MGEIISFDDAAAAIRLRSAQGAARRPRLAPSAQGVFGARREPAGQGRRGPPAACPPEPGPGRLRGPIRFDPLPPPTPEETAALWLAILGCSSSFGHDTLPGVPTRSASLPLTRRRLLLTACLIARRKGKALPCLLQKKWCAWPNPIDRRVRSIPGASGRLPPRRRPAQSPSRASSR